MTKIDKMEHLYINYLKESVQKQIANEIDNSKIDSIVALYLNRYFQKSKSRNFQLYYFKTLNNSDSFHGEQNFFREFKRQYSLQGIDNEFLDKLESEKVEILNCIRQNDLAKLYLEKFRYAKLKHRGNIRITDLSSFFAKIVHTFNPENYCALDNPIKNYFKLDKESFYLSFLVISSEYKNWAIQNQNTIKLLKSKIETLDTDKVIDLNKLTDLKLLDLIFWSKANPN